MSTSLSSGTLSGPPLVLPVTRPLTRAVGTRGETGYVVSRVDGLVRVRWDDGQGCVYDLNDEHGKPTGHHSGDAPWLDYIKPLSPASAPPSPNSPVPAPRVTRDEIEAVLAPLADLLWKLAGGRVKP